MSDKEFLHKLWQWHEEAKAQEQALAARNVAGLSADERFEADMAYQVASRRRTEAWLAYQQALGEHNP